MDNNGYMYGNWGTSNTNPGMGMGMMNGKMGIHGRMGMRGMR